MPPVGNDIVDLEESGNRGKSGDGRFLGRIFTPEERELIAGADCPDALLWSLWAAKEAAYKAVSRDNPDVCSIPRRYRAILGTAPLFFSEENRGDIPIFSGCVFTPQGELALRVAVAEGYVHALTAGSEAELERIVQHVDRVGVAEDAGDFLRSDHAGDCENIPDPSAFVRRRVLREIARRNRCPFEDLEIRNDPVGPGAPRVFLRGLLFAADISLSHDGRFAAFALLAD
ncbi:MAG: 4'-phosphopantetheinyl transferase superfamily protein [Proteobacteria bacterium]|nr:4'-phosphopantetheinyl transferase superfamily protein [Pseudomonadota bacterium]MBU2260400.1 4'-phosphopantetheinyl transferase superfamily protein [Pseudomonadota bacterium]